MNDKPDSQGCEHKGQKWFRDRPGAGGQAFDLTITRTANGI